MTEKKDKNSFLIIIEEINERKKLYDDKNALLNVKNEEK